MEKDTHVKDSLDEITSKDLSDILRRTDEMLTADEWEGIKAAYKFTEGFNRARCENWHRTVTRDATRFAIAVINGGGTAKEIRNACIYVRICADAKKEALGYIQFSKDHHLIDVKNKYGLDALKTIK